MLTGWLVFVDGSWGDVVTHVQTTDGWAFSYTCHIFTIKSNKVIIVYQNQRIFHF